MKKIKVEVNVNDFPVEIQHLFLNSTIYDSSCSKDAVVYYIDTGYYVKIDKPNSLLQEANSNMLFYKMGIGVEVVAYITKEKDYLVTRSAKGEDLTHYIEKPENLCKILAECLKNLHSKSCINAPISPKMVRYMEIANSDIQSGSFDDYVLMEKYMIHTKEEAWSIIQNNKHLLKINTIIHGDACLPNIIQENDKFSAFIDCILSGMGDKHIDIYWAIWSLKYNLGTDEYTELFLDLYGREDFNDDILKVIAAFEYYG